MRKRHSAEFKAKIALEALRGLRPIHEIAAKHGVHPNQISAWKRQAVEGLPGLFSGMRDRKEEQEAELRDRLYRQIGELQVELEWLRKKSDGLG
jgi:putative transposase